MYFRSGNAVCVLCPFAFPIASESCHGEIPFVCVSSWRPRSVGSSDRRIAGSICRHVVRSPDLGSGSAAGVQATGRIIHKQISDGPAVVQAVGRKDRKPQADCHIAFGMGRRQVKPRARRRKQKQKLNVKPPQGRGSSQAHRVDVNMLEMYFSHQTVAQSKLDHLDLPFVISNLSTLFSNLLFFQLVQIVISAASLTPHILEMGELG